jgi:multidrug efflux system membrane fusion protein
MNGKDGPPVGEGREGRVGVGPMNHRRIAAIALLVSAPLAGCGHATKESVKSTLPAFTVAKAVSDEVTDYEEFPGHLDAFKQVEIRARVGGYLVEALFADGDEVKEGADLFLVDPRPYEAQLAQSEASVKKADAHLARLNSDVRRANSLFARGAINRQEADRSEGDYAEAKADRDRSLAAYELAKLDMGYTRVTAPIAGRLGRRLVDPGTLVRAGVTPLATIVALDPIYVYLNVDEHTSRKLIGFARSLGFGEHELTALVGLADQPGEFPYPVTVTFSDNQVDAASGTLSVRGAIPNPIRADGSRMFVPGMYARVRVPLGSPRRALLVPDRALGTDQGRKFLYVVDPEHRIVFRPVVTGPAHKGMRVIEEGLRPDESFVAGDVSRIMAGMAISPVPIADPWTLAGDGTGAAPKSAPPFVVPTKGQARPDGPVPRAPAPVLPMPTRGRR